MEFILAIIGALLVVGLAYLILHNQLTLADIKRDIAALRATGKPFTGPTGATGA